MNVDHFFTIGSGHHAAGTPCEDYALSGVLPNGTAFGVVADGCSGARANTDVGARALSWAFKQSLAQLAVEPGAWFSPGFSVLLKETFSELQFTSSLEDYLATVVGFAATPEKASVFVQGDGAIAVRYTDGRRRLIQFNWWDNMPFYLNYQLHPRLLNEFLAPYRDGVIEPFVQRTTVTQESSAGRAVLSEDYARFSVDQVFGGHVLHFNPAEEGIEAIAVLTDGIEQVGDAPAIEVVSELLSFKNHKGEFVKRRAMKALKDFRRDGFIPKDDVGIAAIWFPGEA